jgi:hypothetical protein
MPEIFTKISLPIILLVGEHGIGPGESGNRSPSVWSGGRRGKRIEQALTWHPDHAKKKSERYSIVDQRIWLGELLKH